MPASAASLHGLPDASNRRSWLSWGVALCVVVVLVAWAAFRAFQPRVAPPPPEFRVTDLERVDGVWRARSGGLPVSGLIVDRHSQGGLKYRSTVREGLLEGLSEGWHANGQLQVRESFRAGVAEGPVERWHPNGQKASEATARAGKLEGTLSRWHDNGLLAERYSLVAGVPHGTAESWFPSGHQKAETLMEQGTVVRQRFWKDTEGPLLNAAQTNQEKR
jgi:MORN repeat variant